ncbi:hypothetical protein GIB67_027932 [Kingdonia uniflora]|uniref:Uncharacterized protein n=1 Tax=Kingdonia uniflora TaxID=39325 RepID=A0A7J7LGW9_9MAGN|nr:hypothetical protein GIB67_027932 [Kingdonia uniflora]
MSATIIPSLISKSPNFISNNHRNLNPNPNNIAINLQFPSKTFSPISKSTSIQLPLFLHRATTSSSSSSSNVENGETLDSESSITEAQGVVSEIIQEAGVSKEESTRIASSSPRYVKMLLDGVRELDELSLWKSWRMGDGDELENLSLKKKVFYMAKEKGDNGKLPFLESVGLNTLSSTHVARYLAAESLPNIIRKVGQKGGETVAERVMVRDKGGTRFIAEKEDLSPSKAMVGAEAGMTNKASEVGERRLIPKDICDGIVPPLLGTTLGYEKFRGRIQSLKTDMPWQRVLSFVVFQNLPISWLKSSKAEGFDVKYVKEMLFSDSDDEGFLGKNARRMMTQLSIFNDEDVQQTLSFFEKMEAKRGGLNILGSKDASFPYLIESFPRLLLLSEESHLVPLVEYLEGLGVPKERVRAIMLLYPPILFYDIQRDIKPRLQAFGKVGAEEKNIGSMLLKYPWILSKKIQENYEIVLSFFEFEKVPKVSVDRAIKSWPYILGCSTSKLKIMMEQFIRLGVKNKKLSQVIASSPQLLLRKPHEFLQVVSFMEQLGFDEQNVGRILGRCPEIFAADIELTLKKKINFIYDFGMSEDHLPRIIRKYPEFLVSDIDNTLLPRMKYLMENGLSKRDVAFMVRKFSPLLGYSIDEVLKPKLEFLVRTMEKPVSDVVKYPRYFSYSLEKKIKPRYWVLKGRNTECSLEEMLGKNDEDFATDYMGIGRMLVPPPSARL